MSRIGNNPIAIPQGVEISVKDSVIDVKGPKGQLTQKFYDGLTISVNDADLVINRAADTKEHKAMHGLYRSLVNNMVTGVSQGFEKKLILQGVGYRAKATGSTLNLTLGFSHPVDYELPEGVKAETPTQTEIVIKGLDKQKVGQVAAEIRGYRPPEPYKGKGVRYADENVRRKEAKKK